MANDLTMRGKDKLQEISMKLEQSHLVYLQTDDSPLKLQQRHKLEGFIKEYLCLVPNENKYVFQETADILHRSAASLQDFSGYRAATAWSAISLYAANLLAQPWRKEYRTLRTYSGYYKHEVEANLIGAELMFEQMGYKHTGLGVLTLEGPIDPDKVSNVSRDAIVAFVECQILKQIWENVSQNCTVSWLEVLEFRENHVGTPEQAIRALNYRFLEKMRQNRTKAENYRDYHYPPTTCIDAAAPSVPYHIMPPNYNMPMSACQTDYNRYIEDTNGIPRYFPPTDHGFMNRCSAYGCLPHANKYFSCVHSNPYYTTMPAYSRVPTGRLIELDVPVSVANYDKLHNRKSSHRIPDLDEVDYYRKQSSDGDHYDYGKVDKRSKAAVDRNNYDSWDFVYRNLESLGYTKDLGDREDILHKRDGDSKIHKQKSFRQNDNDENHSGYRFEKKRSGRTEVNDVDSSITNGRHHYHDTLPFKKKSSSFDLTDSNKCHADSTSESHLSSHNKDKKHSSQTLPIQRSHRSSDQIAKIADTIKSFELSHSQKEYGVKDEHKWNCATCTYLNSLSKEICEMCGKSRHKGNEDKPLASGGKECPQCTLVNEKNVSICDVCGTSLKDSPTYI
ncbi:PREDICTED: protein tamozhennic [Dufourea novaeangliae]|uniref:Protein tamozhennic n=1 Tax=Dufourea novaeangliae TaxID=178035 RepID=A0A154PIX0_DUFNO|nr:PREDICTED: protein tamozhennic [Dufourea novaeangliae]KZC11753.1 Protein tamozhennic [Dufourea novaeangliae]